MLRQGSLRDERRRRSLLEDAAIASDDGATPKPRRTSKVSETYTDLARMDAHARWSDFVPLRNWTVAAFLAAGVASIAALEAAYYFAAQSELWTHGELAALDLARANSLAGWMISLALFVTAVLSYFIYSVRRYRLDDYRGRYRVWLWGAALWMVMSLDAVADLRGAVEAACIALSGRVGPAGGIAWWLGPWCVAIIWLGARMFLDARACRSATASFVLFFCLLPAGLILRRVGLPISGSEMVMLSSGCWLVAGWLLLFAHIAYARHVLLDAHGQLPVRVAKPKREKKPKTAVDEKVDAKANGNSGKRRDDLTTRIDPPHSSSFRAATTGIDLQKPALGRPQPVASKVTAGIPAAAAPAKPSTPPAKTTQFVSGREDDEESRQPHKLSRADRKRLRKQQRGGRLDDDE